MCPNSRKKMSRLLNTYTYTCRLVSKQYSSLSTNFPVLFFVAYRHWVESARRLTLQEVSEDVLADLSEEAAHDSNLAILVDDNKEETGASKYCFLVDCATEKKVKVRIYFVKSENTNKIMGTPTCMTNISILLNKDVDALMRSEFVFITCEDDHTPAAARDVKVSAVQSKLLNSIPIMEMDQILGEYFERPRFLCKGTYFCIDIKRHISIHNVHVLPLIKDESRVYFIIEDLIPDKHAELDDDDLISEGMLVSKFQSQLSQIASVKQIFPSESVLTNNNKHFKHAPAFFSSNLEYFLNIQRRYQRNIDKMCFKSCLTFLVGSEPGSGCHVITQALASKLGYSLMETRGRDMVGDTSGATEALIKRAASNAKAGKYLVWVISDVNTVVLDKDNQFDDRAFLSLQESLCDLPQDVIVLGICNCLGKTEPRLASLFVHHKELAPLKKEDRKEMLAWHIENQNVTLEDGVKLEKWSKVTSGFNFSDLKYLLDFALDIADGLGVSVITEECFDKALVMINSSRSDSLGLAEVPSVRWDQVGGLAEAKDELLQAIDSPIPGNFGRAGVLLYGPPGVGKTLLAKAVATECSLNFMSVKGPELLNMYVGQSEENVRQVFARAKEAQPCVVFFDELDSLVPNRGQAGDSGGVMDRVVSALLAELDRLENCEVTVIGATNRPDLVDPALLRPGRFDRLVYLGITSDPSQKLLIVKALTKNLNISDSCDLGTLCERLPDGLTGADLSSWVSDAALRAIKRTIEEIESGNVCCEAEVTDQDFLDALETIKPSVSSEDLKNYENLRYNLRKH